MRANRRTFLTSTCLSGVAALGCSVAEAQKQPGTARDYYELQQYEVKAQAQVDGLTAFMEQAAIPALNRIGINPVGVFLPAEGISPIYVLLRHRSVESMVTATQKLLADQEFLQKGAAFLDAPASDPAYVRVQSSLMVAFATMPELERPITDPGRVFQLRTYESPSLKAGQKKIEMFNVAEIGIFRKVGLHPVFFGETLVGAKMPNLTYMLVFRDMQEKDENWKRFGADPDWQKLRAVPEYSDKLIISGITNLFLKPAECSQI